MVKWQHFTRQPKMNSKSTKSPTMVYTEYKTEADTTMQRATSKTAKQEITNGVLNKISSIYEQTHINISGLDGADGVLCCVGIVGEDVIESCLSHLRE